MKLKLSPTSTVATIAGTATRARLWKGTDELGTPVHAYVLAVSPQTNDPERTAPFDRELEPADPVELTADMPAIEARFIL
jgi:hypothetical protein